MCVDHVLCETGYCLVRRLAKLFFNLIVGFVNHVISEVIRIRPFSPPPGDLFMVIIYFFDLVHHTHPLFRP